MTSALPSLAFVFTDVVPRVWSPLVFPHEVCVLVYPCPSFVLGIPVQTQPGLRDGPPPPPEGVVVRSPCQEKDPADAHPSAHKSQVSAGVGKPSMDSECASGCAWSTARATARLWDSRTRSSQTGQVIQGRTCWHNQNTFGPTEAGNGQWQEANRRCQRQINQNHGFLPDPPQGRSCTRPEERW